MLFVTKAVTKYSCAKLAKPFYCISIQYITAIKTPMVYRQQIYIFEQTTQKYKSTKNNIQYNLKKT